MIPGMNPRKAAQMMKRMGIQQQEIDATEVIIRTKENEIILHSPAVSKVNMMGQETYQVVGEEEVRPLEPEINEDDIKTVMEQAGVGREVAVTAIKDHNFDLAEAILELKQ